MRNAQAKNALLFLLTAAAGCGDLETAPPVELGTEESVPSLLFGTTLPSLPDLTANWGHSLPLDDLDLAWSESWAGPPERGARARAELYQAILPTLANEVPSSEIARQLRSVEIVLNEIDARFGQGVPAPLGTPVGEARREHAEGLQVLEIGRLDEALRHLLHAADHLRSTTPRAIARALIEETESLLRTGDRPAQRRNSLTEPYDPQRTTRAERLLTGARAALDEGQDALALRRAYYAHRILAEPTPW